MRTSIASDAAPGGDNEDFAAATANAIVILDGAGLSGVDDGGCKHGVGWYTRRLGCHILARLSDAPRSRLSDAVASAISDVAEAHRHTCDLDHPGTPSSTVLVVRVADHAIDYLVLADSVLVIETNSGHQVVSDTREAEVGRRYRTTMDSTTGGTPAHDEARRAYVETLRGHRNQPDGFWVAAAAPEAAHHGITGTLDVDEARTMMLLTDGASRIVDRFGLHDWSWAQSLVSYSGPQALIRAVRDAEHSDPSGQRWPRGKIHDDATVAYCDRW